MQKKHTAADLNKLYQEADSCDREIFAEMRSNILLNTGDHYSKKNSKFYQRIQDEKALSKEQKLRLTRNHIQKITSIYANQILTAAPGVKPSPHNPKELSDQKAAEMHDAVWQDAKIKHDLDGKIADWADDFQVIGEVHTMLVYDPNAGGVKGYEQAVSQDGYLLFTDPAGQDSVYPTDDQNQPHEPKRDLNKPIMRGQLKFKNVYGFNLLRHPGAQTIDESPWVVIREMVNTEDAIALIPKGSQDGHDYDMLVNKVKSSGEQPFRIFDSQSGQWKESQDQVLLKTTLFRPCALYPNGYWYYVIGEQTIAEGEIPFGIFPLISEPNGRIQTSPRGRSPIKAMRPLQVEINRCASSIAEAQMTNTDKLVMQYGSKMSQGATYPGVRAFTVTGAPPTILPGRSGDQYFAYLEKTIEELYRIMMVEEFAQEQNGQLDAMVMIFRSASQKQKFSRPIKRFERFLRRVCETYLELQRNYLEEDEIIQIVGKREAVNIAEFKNSTKLCYQIKVEAQAEDIESKMGRQMVLNHLLQYTSGKLEKEDIGKIYRLMPYGNSEEMATDLTIDYDNGTNMILALDRGELPEANLYDTKPYMIRRLTTRARQADFKQLAPQIQNNYQVLKKQYEDMIVKEQQAIQAAQADFIPTGGYLVVCDIYIADPMNPAKTRRARLPYESIQWLVKRLEQQGSSLQQLEQMSQGALGELSTNAIANRPARHGTESVAQGQAPAEMGQGAPVNGRPDSQPSNPGRINSFDPGSVGSVATPANN